MYVFFKKNYQKKIDRGAEILEKSFNNIDNQKKYFNDKMSKNLYILSINFDYKNKASITLYS